MQGSEIKELIDQYIENKNSQGCFLIKGDWGIGKTHFINTYIKENRSKKEKTTFIRMSLFEKKDLSQIDAEINSRLMPSYKKNLLKLSRFISPAASHSFFTLNLNLTAFFSEKNQLEKKSNSKIKIVFIFDDLERVSNEIAGNILGYINNINENYGFKVITIANTNEFSEDMNDTFSISREKVFFTEVSYGESFEKNAQEILNGSSLKDYEEEIIRQLLRKRHYNLRSLLFAVQKIEQLLQIAESSLDEEVNSSLIRTVVKYSAQRGEPPKKVVSGETGLGEAVAELLSQPAVAYNMSFLDAFVRNEEYSLEAIKEHLSAIQQFAKNNKENPLPQLKEWFFLKDKEYEAVLNKVGEWIREDRMDVLQYSDILRTIESDFFVDKLKMFRDPDVYLGGIIEAMKDNLQNKKFEELHKLQQSVSWGFSVSDKRKYLGQLQDETRSLMDKEIGQIFDCDRLFAGEHRDNYNLLNELAMRGKDLLDVCDPEQIMERIKTEDDLELIENARGLLLGFYRSYFPLNLSVNERQSKLKENEYAHSLILSLKEYKEKEGLEKSKCFIIDTLIKTLEGDYL